MKKNWNFSMAQFLWYDCTFKKQCTAPVTLTFDLWRSLFFHWIESHPRSVLYKFEIDISSNSREIKYQNIGRTHTQTDTQTDRVKTIPRNPLWGRGNKPIEPLCVMWSCYLVRLIEDFFYFCFIRFWNNMANFVICTLYAWRVCNFLFHICIPEFLYN